MAMATSLYKFKEALKPCDKHESKELSFFCKTCKKFICKHVDKPHTMDMFGIVLVL